MIGIRVDVNKEVASGHIMRSLAIAKQLAAMGKDVVFFCADANAEPYTEKFGYKTCVLDSDWKDMESELSVLLKAIDEYDVSSLLVDSYQITPAYMKTLCERVLTPISAKVQLIKICDANPLAKGLHIRRCYLIRVDQQRRYVIFIYRF